LLECNCHRPGTIGAVGFCDAVDGQCACKPNVGGPSSTGVGDSAGASASGRTCDTCLDGFFGLDASNGFGCEFCACDVGGTQLARGQDAVCDKETGQCQCRTGMNGRRYGAYS
jgi:hypothetical protein